MSIDKKAILYWCDSVEKEFESLNAVIGGDKIVPKKFLDTSIQYLRALCEEKEEYSEPPPRVGVKVVVKDTDGQPWEIELEPEYHSQLIGEIESQIPEKSEGGSIRYSLEYNPEKIWNMRKLEG